MRLEQRDEETGLFARIRYKSSHKDFVYGFSHASAHNHCGISGGVLVFEKIRDTSLIVSVSGGTIGINTFSSQRVCFG